MNKKQSQNNGYNSKNKINEIEETKGKINGNMSKKKKNGKKSERENVRRKLIRITGRRQIKQK